MLLRGIVTENQVDSWVRGNAQKAQGAIVELISRLVYVSCPKPNERRFPLGDSINQPGPDGFLDTDEDYRPFIPEGKSYWEIGTGGNPGNKATSDYKELTAATPDDVRKLSTFIFVTPLSGMGSWSYSWKEKAQQKWQHERERQHQWRDIKIIDCTKLVDWLHHFPAVELWFANIMGLPVEHLQTLEQHWIELKTIGAPPPLLSKVFTVDREEACEKLRSIFDNTVLQLKLDTHFPSQVADFVAAYVAELEDNLRMEIMGRSLVVSSADDWKGITELKDKHILVANFSLDREPDGIKLLEKAHRAGHSVIYGSIPGSIPHLFRAPLPRPKPYHLQEALKESGYTEQRASILAAKSSGDLNSLLKCLQGLSLMPEWAQSSESSELVIADLLGSWNEKSEGDIIAIEQLLGKSYGEWIGIIRKFSQISGTPLEYRNNIWKFSMRYEGWYSLGPLVFDGQLDKFREIAVNVLREKNPKFDLRPEDRMAASLYNKVLNHSSSLRQGLAETITLLGSHPGPLNKCTVGKPEGIARAIVREVFKDADWELWASLNDIIPLLAEAAPREFLDAIDLALVHQSSIPQKLLSEKGGMFSENLATGLLWALELLAWDPNYLARSTCVLAALTSIDVVKSNSGNTPINSLTTIFLPWCPQTCASFEQRKHVIEILVKENPDATWKLLIKLFPRAHSFSTGSYKPSWRTTIPEDWLNSITIDEYWEQVESFFSYAFQLADSADKLIELIDHIEGMPPSTKEEFLAKILTDSKNISKEDRIKIWNKLIYTITRHRKYRDSNWAMKSKDLESIEKVAKAIEPNEPFFVHQRLFNHGYTDLFEEKGDYQEQVKRLEKKRESAICAIYSFGGVKDVIDFAIKVESPWHVGFAFAMSLVNCVDEEEILSIINDDNIKIVQFIGGYISGKHRMEGWTWFDRIYTDSWTMEKKAMILSNLPFEKDTWERVAQFLGDDQSLYWLKTDVRPFSNTDNPQLAISKLIEYGRSNEAAQCIHYSIDMGVAIEPKLIIACLKAIASSKESQKAIDTYDISKIIEYLQKSTSDYYDEILGIEWIYLKILDHETEGSPVFLEQRLADDPKFYNEIISYAFKSKNEEIPKEDLTEKQRLIALHAYTLLHNWRTPPGLKKDGTFDGELLKEWVKDVKEICKETGHLEIALSRFGHVLVYSPMDPDGLWIHINVAQVLNEKDMNEARNGFQTELINSRGVYTWSQGKEEQELARKYLRMGNDLESNGFHRFADTLKELSQRYETESRRESIRDSFED